MPGDRGPAALATAAVPAIVPPTPIPARPTVRAAPATAAAVRLRQAPAVPVAGKPAARRRTRRPGRGHGRRRPPRRVREEQSLWKSQA